MKTSRSLLTALAAVLFSSHLFAASTAISGLPAASSVASTNLTVVVDLTEPNPALQTKKANISQLVDGLPAASSGAKGTMSAADKIKLDAATASASVSTLVLRNSSGDSSFHSIALTGGTVSAAPSNPTDITNKAYVDAVSTGLAVHTPAVAATTGTNITLAGGAPSTLDGVTLSSSNRILVKDQTDLKQNGIYTVSVLGSGANGTWVRATDADTGAELVSGSYIFINGGTTWASSAWVMTTPGAIVIGTSDINWTLFNQVTNILASNIIGQIVQAQIADASINTAKFASGIQPVSVVSSLPSPSGYTGPRTIFNTSDSKLYRYDGAAFTTATATTDLSGTITNTQIADNSISTPKLQANAVTAAKIAANTITANEIAADTITAGQIAAGAVNTSELAANAVTAAKITAGTITTTQIAAATILASNIAAGTITADRMNVSTLSAISANLGTITAGTINSVTINTATINSPTGTIGGFTIASNTMTSLSGNFGFDLRPATSGSGEVLMTYSGANFVSLTETTAGGLLQLGKAGVANNIQLVGQTGAISGVSLALSGAITGATSITASSTIAGASLALSGTITGATSITASSTVTGGSFSTSGAITATGTITGGAFTTSGAITATSTDSTMGARQLTVGTLYSGNADGWTPIMTGLTNNISFKWSGSALHVRIDATDLIIDTHP
jgi:hypothetical protein